MLEGWPCFLDVDSHSVPAFWPASHPSQTRCPMLLSSKLKLSSVCCRLSNSLLILSPVPCSQLPQYLTPPSSEPRMVSVEWTSSPLVSFPLFRCYYVSHHFSVHFLSLKNVSFPTKVPFSSWVYSF